MILSKEELEKEYPMSGNRFPHNPDLDKRTKKLAVRISFEVTCDSSPYIGYENSIAKRIREYIKECSNAMDESMRHWGDHEHCIDPVRVIISDIETEEEQNITTEILGEDETV